MGDRRANTQPGRGRLQVQGRWARCWPWALVGVLFLCPPTAGLQGPGLGDGISPVGNGETGTELVPGVVTATLSPSYTWLGKCGTGSAQLGLDEHPVGAAGVAQALVALWDVARGDTAPLQRCGVSPSSFQHPSPADTMPDWGHPGKGLGHVGGPSWPPPVTLWDTRTLLPGCRGLGVQGGMQGSRSSGAEPASVQPQLQQEHVSRSPPNVCAEIQQRLHNEEPAVVKTRSGARAAGPGAAGSRGSGHEEAAAASLARHRDVARHWDMARHSTAWHSTAQRGTAVPWQKQHCNAKF